MRTASSTEVSFGLSNSQQYTNGPIYGNLIYLPTLPLATTVRIGISKCDADYITLLDVIDAREITLVGIEISLHSLAVYGYCVSRLASLYL